MNTRHIVFHVKQRGVALITALLIMMLAVSTASFIIWQQSLWVHQLQNVTNRSKADILAIAVLDWSRALLADTEVLKTINQMGNYSVLIPDVEEDAKVSGILTDAQGLFNVNNLVRSNKRSQPDIDAFQRLLIAIKISPDVAKKMAEDVADWICQVPTQCAPASDPDMIYLSLSPSYTAAKQPLLDTSELIRIRGFTEAILTRLTPFIVALPVESSINVNAAPAEVLSAIFNGLTQNAAVSIVAARKVKAFEKIGDFNALLPPNADKTSIKYDIQSQYFLASTHVKVGDMEVSYVSLLVAKKNSNPNPDPNTPLPPPSPDTWAMALWTRGGE